MDKLLNLKIKDIKLSHLVIGLFLTLVLTWEYGYLKAMTHHFTGNLNLITAVLNVTTLNPISADGYKTYIQNSRIFENL